MLKDLPANKTYALVIITKGVWEKLSKWFIKTAKNEFKPIQSYYTLIKDYLFGGPFNTRSSNWTICMEDGNRIFFRAIRSENKRLFIRLGVENVEILDVGNLFLEMAAWGDDKKIQILLEEGFSVNYQDSQTGSTALHRAAAHAARDVVRVLMKQDECDFLKRDNKGRLSSELAYLYGHDPALARLLGIKERIQAARHGVTLMRRPQA